jgi:predicted HTH transcriptional regulator
MRIDPTYAGVSFAYRSLPTGEPRSVKTLEEIRYPQHYAAAEPDSAGDGSGEEPGLSPSDSPPVQMPVADLIQLGESATLEFKSSFEWDMKQDKHVPQLSQTCVKSVAAFLNSSGGVLLVGVADDGSIVGLERDIALAHNTLDGLQLKMMSKFTEYIGVEFAGLINIRFETLDGKTVAVIDVQKASKPAFIKGNDFYLRVGNATHKLSTVEALAYINMHRFE